MNRLAELQQLIADFAKVERMPELANNKNERMTWSTVSDLP